MKIGIFKNQWYFPFYLVQLTPFNVNTGKVNTQLYSNTPLDTKLRKKANSNKIQTSEHINLHTIRTKFHVFGSN